MNPFVLIFASLAIAVVYIAGRLQGRIAATNYIVDHIRARGEYCVLGEVIIGNVLTWEQYSARSSRHSAEKVVAAKHEAPVQSARTPNYRHPFLNRESDA